MNELFSISQAAKLAGMTSETLRHYDRIGLVKPSRVDEWTGYRYYTQKDVVRLNTVHALAQMDLSLKEIREVLSYDDLAKIIAFLERAEHRADEKIRELERGKEKLRLARADYARKLGARRPEQAAFLQELPRRVILLSDAMESPTLENLWNYHRPFFDQLPPEARDSFAFEDLAGIYSINGRSRLFAQCSRYGEDPRLTVLPAGPYLCADCTEENREQARSALVKEAKERWGITPAFTAEMIVISGILQWTYQIQIPLEESGKSVCLFPDPIL